MSQIDYLNQCREILKKVFQQLSSDIEDNQVSEIAKIITEAMGGNYRYFHNFNHILMLSKTNDPLITLAGLFHDIVYIQVDQQIRFNITPYLTPFVEERNGDLFIKSLIYKQEKELEIIIQIFGLNKGENLSKFTGINEFLSALTAARILSPYLPLMIITRLVAIIELTIPFRQAKEKALTIPQQLQKRLEKVNQQYFLGLEKGEIILTVTQAVKLANLDVSGFAFANVEEFIHNTWLLLPEMNHCLISLDKSTVKEYITALAKMERFFSFLSPEFIFHYYKNEPTLDIWQQLVSRSKHNLAVAKLYLSAIVVSLSIIDALCSRFSHHISLSFLFGFSPYQSNKFLSIVDFLPSKLCEYETESDLEKKVLSLIQCQPKPDFFSTLQYSVLVDFVVSYLGFQQVEKLLPQCHLFIKQKISGEEFLQVFPPDLIKVLAQALALLLAKKQKDVMGTIDN